MGVILSGMARGYGRPILSSTSDSRSSSRPSVGRGDAQIDVNVILAVVIGSECRRLAHNPAAKCPRTAPATCHRSPVTRVLWPLWVLSGLLQDGERDVIVVGGGFEVWADVVAGDCDRAAESLGGGECLGHGGRERSPPASMAMLK